MICKPGSARLFFYKEEPTKLEKTGLREKNEQVAGSDNWSKKVSLKSAGKGLLGRCH